MADLDQFQKNLLILTSKIERNINNVVKKAALAVHSAVVLATPVDTGRARSNWLVAIGSPTRSTRTPFSAGKKLGLQEGANASAAIAAGEQIIFSRKITQDIFISNNLDYIADLNRGTSAQAPALFVEQAVKVGQRILRSIKIVKK